MRTSFTMDEIDELASVIADPQLPLSDIPKWPQWFLDLSAREQDLAMRTLFSFVHPKLEEEMHRLDREV